MHLIHLLHTVSLFQCKPSGVKVQVLGNDMVWRCKEAHTSTPFELHLRCTFAIPAVHMAHLLSPKEGFALKNCDACTEGDRRCKEDAK